MGYLATSFLWEKETKDVGIREGFPWSHTPHERPALAVSRCLLVLRKLGQVLSGKQEGPRDLAAWHQ